MFRLIQRLALLAVLCLLVGCSAYPKLKADASLKAPNPTKEWLCFGSQFASSTPDGKLQQARGCALATLDEFNKLLGRAARDDRTMSYALWGLGAWAGARAIDTDSNDEVLRNITVAVAGLLGFRQVAGTAAQRKILNQGITAIRCVIDAADAVQQANQKLTAVNASGILKKATASADPETMMSMVGVTPNADPKVNATFRILSSLVETQLEPLSSLESSISSAQSGLGLQLASAVQTIRQVVRTELANSAPDPTAVFDAQRTLVDSMVKQISDAGEQGEQGIAIVDALVRNGLSTARIGDLKSIAAASTQPTNVREQCVYGPQPGS